MSLWSIILSLGLVSIGQAQDLRALLERGPVVLVETKKNGKFHSATAVINTKTSIDATWKVITDFGGYKAFIPNLVESTPKRVQDNVIDVSYEVEVPGPNPEYTFRYTLKPEAYSMGCRWVSGDLKNSFCKWRLVSTSPTETLIYYTTASRNFSSLAQSLEDDQQTITVGVNVSAALAAVKAIKRRAEGK